MKKFFSVMTLQKEGRLDSYKYKAVGSERLSVDSCISFPILAAINGYVAPGEDFALVTLVTDTEDGRRNYVLFREQVTALCEKRGFNLPEFRTVTAPNEDGVSVQLSLFQKLIDQTEDEDDLYVCITYGTKPMSQTLLMAVKYSYTIKKNTSIGCVVYGRVDRSGPQEAWYGEVYDMTALLRMEEIVNKLAASGTSDPEKVIKKILDL